MKFHTKEKKDPSRDRIIVIGAGFAGIQVAKAFKNKDCDVLLIDRQNHHLFQPLIYQVAGGLLHASDVSTPIRTVLGKAPNTFIRMEEVRSVDRDAKTVSTEENTYYYDHLVVSTGSDYNFFGNDQWREHCFTLKTLSDAVKLRNHIYTSLEKACTTSDKELRKKLLSFVIIGGGPTGVELAGQVAEITKQLTDEELKISFDEIEIYLIEAADRIMLAFEPDMSSYTKQKLEEKGVKVCLNNMVKEIQACRMISNSMEISANTIIWAAGVKGVGAAKFFPEVKAQRNNTLAVNEFLNLKVIQAEGENSTETIDENIFIAGDCSMLMQENGRPLPGLGSVAKQQGAYLVQALKAKVAKKNFEKPFKYTDMGIMATIGKNAAIAQFGNLKFTGFIAWFLWGFVHILLLISFKNQISVFIGWIWTFILGKIHARSVPRQVRD